MPHINFPFSAAAVQYPLFPIFFRYGITLVNGNEKRYFLFFALRYIKERLFSFLLYVMLIQLFGSRIHVSVIPVLEMEQFIVVQFAYVII